MTSRVYYKPLEGWVGDVVPFHKDGVHYLFYLHAWRDTENHGRGVPWFLVTTRDFRTFEEHGEVLSRGTCEDQDLFVFTGCVVEDREGGFHIFYTGNNPDFQKQGRPRQAIMHAVSDDLHHWWKVPEDTFFADESIYERNDWRDPFVFWNEDAGEYWMLLAARVNTGPSRRRGCTALCVSRDLGSWEIREPLWAAGLYFTHECPDLFPMGNWWYLLFSEFSERHVTRYRIAGSPAGPWILPGDDTFDNNVFYAAKTVSDGNRRFLLGWNPSREGETDYGPPQWGGHIAVHELWQRADGTLAVRLPAEIREAFPQSVAIQPRPGLGPFMRDSGGVTVKAPDTFACSLAGELPSYCRITARVAPEEGTRACGLLLRCSKDLEAAYQIRLEPGNRRLVFEAWPRAHASRFLPFMLELERPIAPSVERSHYLEVIVDETVCQAYIDGSLAISARMYDRAEGGWGWFAQQGTARFTDLELCVPDTGEEERR